MTPLENESSSLRTTTITTTTTEKNGENILDNVHVHLPETHLSDNITTRFLGSIIPLHWQHHLRDSGTFRSITDSLVASAFGPSALVYPSAAASFVKLSQQCQTIRYGSHPSQYIDMFFPTNNNDNNNPSTNTNIVSGLLFFVHGGAWGSGKPWQYRLVALPFLKLNMAVAIVGYRVYPDANTPTQVQDLQAAYAKLTQLYPNLCGLDRTCTPTTLSSYSSSLSSSSSLQQQQQQPLIGLCISGHSSGAHIAFLMLVEQVQYLLEKKRKGSSHDPTTSKQETTMHRNKTFWDAFIGISGPYDISHHFDFEAGRGVEEISPMKPANGYTREQFRRNTPALRLRDLLTTFSEGSTNVDDSKGARGEERALSLKPYFPKTLFVHGIEDTTVPYTSTSKAARIVRQCGIDQCHEQYVPGTGHQDAIIHMMLGGRVKTAIMDWLTHSHHHMDSSSASHSRL